MTQRRTIRPKRDVVDTLQAAREELGLSWDDYLMALYEDHDHTQTVELPEEQIDEIARRTAEELEGRLR